MKSPFNQRMRLADYDDAIELYSQLERQRDLTELERDRLYQLIERRKRCVYGARYRAKNPEAAKASRDKWRLDPKNQAKITAIRKAEYQDNKAQESERARKWREANPDKIRAMVERRNQRKADLTASLGPR